MLLKRGIDGIGDEFNEGLSFDTIATFLSKPENGVDGERNPLVNPKVSFLR